MQYGIGVFGEVGCVVMWQEDSFVFGVMVDVFVVYVDYYVQFVVGDVDRKWQVLYGQWQVVGVLVCFGQEQVVVFLQVEQYYGYEVVFVIRLEDDWVVCLEFVEFVYGGGC